MLIDGRLLATQILENLKQRVEKLVQEKSITPHLGIILVGQDPASESYIRQKVKMAHEIHADATVYKYPDKIPQEELLQNISFLQTKTALHGLIVQLPLPKHLDEKTIIESVEQNLDVDGFRNDSLFTEPIAEAILYILKNIFDLENKKYKKNDDFSDWLRTQNIVILGKGRTGGMPVIRQLRTMNIEPKIIDSKTEHPQELICKADILICAVGNRGVLVHEGLIKNNAILIGIGMHKGKDGKIHGDYNEEDIKIKAKYYTPIPGGVGPVNAAMLMQNVVLSAEKSFLSGMSGF